MLYMQRSRKSVLPNWIGFFLPPLGFVVAPYVQGVSVKVRRVFSNYGIFTCFKPHQTLRQLQIEPKDKTKFEELVLFIAFLVGVQQSLYGWNKEKTTWTR